MIAGQLLIGVSALVVSIFQWKRKLGHNWKDIGVLEKIRCVITSSFSSPRMATDRRLREHNKELYERLNEKTRGFYSIHGRNIGIAAILFVCYFLALVLLESIF